jgi:hypothetical protein
MELWFSSIAASPGSAQDQADVAAGKLACSSPQGKAVLQGRVDASKAGRFPKGAKSIGKFMDDDEGPERGTSARTIDPMSDVTHWMRFGRTLKAS